MKAAPPVLRVLPLVAALACALALPHVPPSSARQTEARGLGVVHIRAEDGKEVKLYDKSFALVIGVSDYAAGWPKLPGVKRDIEEVTRALELHGFLVTKVEDPDSAQLDKAFKTFIDEHGLGVENRLLFYFAGHGHTIKQSYGEEMGYIVPADAPNPNRDRAGFMSKAMDMQQIELYARRAQSKHALFLFDSCFSGALFALSRAVPDSISYKTARPVRQFITSGSADEQVPDQSIFRRQFVEALEGEADANRDGYVTGAELGEFLQDRVVNYSRNAQHPQYGKIRNPNLDKGDFVFALPRTTKPPVAANTSPTPAPPALVDPAAVELAFWDAIKNSTDPEDFREYLNKYPAGQFAGIAQRRLASLTASTSTKPTTGAPNVSPAPPKPGTVVRARSGIELVYVPPGEFMMGSDGWASERPVHQVTIREGFWMGKYEVTQKQWRAVMGRNPSRSAKGDSLPVDTVSWNDAQEFISGLNAKNDGFVYRLPTEAEWEYACRAGTTEDYADDGQQANGFGLYDMQGKKWEWVQDYYHDDYSGAPTDGSAWLSGGNSNLRVVRGGNCYYGEGRNGRTPSCRTNDNPAERSFIVGLRVVAVSRQ